ncbi:hypothetical protein GCM10010384_10760 [Streptomyces djakartensis]|uniref:Transposase n=1 Tax=Streptomyces djakartensis TaxID=68193 RepID=A0ABQ2ZCH1_9ACTN|nr:hypothetical protein GCM10010384_10760 [Streptomyces djakartensis]
MEPLPDHRPPDLAAEPLNVADGLTVPELANPWEWLISPAVNPFLRSRKSHSKVNHERLWQTIRRVTAEQ